MKPRLSGPVRTMSLVTGRRVRRPRRNRNRRGNPSPPTVRGCRPGHPAPTGRPPNPPPCRPSSRRDADGVTGIPAPRKIRVTSGWAMSRCPETTVVADHDLVIRRNTATMAWGVWEPSPGPTLQDRGCRPLLLHLRLPPRPRVRRPRHHHRRPCVRQTRRPALLRRRFRNRRPVIAARSRSREATALTRRPANRSPTCWPGCRSSRRAVVGVAVAAADRLQFE
ncbi:hypothetical protein LAUMK136_05054 [Mycobacterium attenuatum]|uniref:Uncharacterized protein n=1 Tax=Mycobacterium attenuatum TaxID=2341086 RepID=A0A498QF21_9MYCO|nr:hypothetical protein LAUMK136_05054 [Mycobacterium attenuatum]